MDNHHKPVKEGKGILRTTGEMNPLIKRAMVSFYLYKANKTLVFKFSSERPIHHKLQGVQFLSED